MKIVYYISHVPEEYRVKYLKKEEIIRRLKKGEIIMWSEAMFPASRHGIKNIHFDGDVDNIRIHTNTFKMLVKEGIIKLKKKTGIDGLEYWEFNIRR